MSDRARVETGDRLRLTRPLVQAILTAVRAGQDHVRIASVTRSDENGGELLLAVQPADIERDRLPVPTPEQEP